MYKRVLRRNLNVETEVVSQSPSGKAFQIQEALTAKALSPLVIDQDPRTAKWSAFGAAAVMYNNVCIYREESNFIILKC